MKLVSRGTDYCGPELISLGPLLLKWDLELIPSPLFQEVPFEGQRKATFLKPKTPGTICFPHPPHNYNRLLLRFKFILLFFSWMLPLKPHCAAVIWRHRCLTSKTPNHTNIKVINTLGCQVSTKICRRHYRQFMRDGSHLCLPTFPWRKENSGRQIVTTYTGTQRQSRRRLLRPQWPCWQFLQQALHSGSHRCLRAFRPHSSTMTPVALSFSQIGNQRLSQRMEFALNWAGKLCPDLEGPCCLCNTCHLFFFFSILFKLGF